MIWLIGSRGMLGQEIAGLLKNEGLTLYESDRETDITDPDALRAFAEGKDIRWILNCSAYTAVEKAEEERDLAYRINGLGVGNIGKIAEEIHARVIHVSTDYVFDGTKDKPLDEEEETGPVSVYGASKLAGEEALKGETNRYFIIRTAWLYGRYGNNFVYTMLKLMNGRESLQVVEDQIGSPTWTRDLASLMGEIIRRDSSDFGIYHFSGEGKTSWYGFACEIYRQGRERGLIASECSLIPCSSEEFPAKVKRPAFSLLNKGKVKSRFNWTIPSWEESLHLFFEQGIEL